MVTKRERPVTVALTDRELLACIMKILVVQDMMQPLLKQLKTLVARIITKVDNVTK